MRNFISRKLLRDYCRKVSPLLQSRFGEVSPVFLILILTIMMVAIGSPGELQGLNLERLSSRFLSNFELLDVEQKSGYLVITAGLGGTTVVDARDPFNPVQLSSYSAGCQYGRLYNTFIGNGLVIGAGRDCPLEILEIDESFQLTQLSTHFIEGFSYEDAALMGDSLLVAAAHGNGIEVIDISEPRFPLSRGSVPLENAWAVRVDGNFAYVADGALGLSIVDISDLSDLKIIGQLPTEGSAKDVRVGNGRAFLALGDAGVAMIDVTDPSSPWLIDRYNTSGLAAHIGINDSLVAVADWDDIEILKYGPGGLLEPAGKKNNGGRVMGIDIAGDIVYVAEWSLLRVYRYGAIDGADLDIDLVDIHFPRTEIGQSVDTTIVLTNSGSSTLTIESASISFGDFTLDVSMPFDIAAGEDQQVTLTYTPTILDGTEEEITFFSNDTDDPAFGINVWGNDVDLRVGDEAPDFTLPLLDGGELTLSDLRGSIVVLSFFASW